MYDPADPYGLANDDAVSREYIHPLFTHGDPLLSAVTEPIPLLPVIPPVVPATPATSPSNASGTREAMWIFMVTGALCPLLGVVGYGFIGFVVGTTIGISLGILGHLARIRRIRAINAGHTELEFSKREVDAELLLGALVVAGASVKAAGWVERRHAALVAQQIQQGQAS